MVSERNAVDAANRPATTASLAADLHSLGVPVGATVMVHSSLSLLGYVCGGAHAVVRALLDTVGTDGTIVMPAHSGDLSEPATWVDPPVPESWWDTIRREMPAYDAGLTPTRKMGAIVECFRHVPGVRRSAHPTVSVAAVGPTAAHIVDGHDLAYGSGERSPLARLYEVDAFVLLLGVTHANNTSLHLAEYRASLPNKPWTTHWSPVIVEGRRQWRSYPDLEGDDSDFEKLGDAFAADTDQQATGPIGAGTARLMRQRHLIDFAVPWMEANRS